MFSIQPGPHLATTCFELVCNSVCIDHRLFSKGRTGADRVRVERGMRRREEFWKGQRYRDWLAIVLAATSAHVACVNASPKRKREHQFYYSLSFIITWGVGTPGLLQYRSYLVRIVYPVQRHRSSICDQPAHKGCNSSVIGVILCHVWQTGYTSTCSSLCGPGCHRNATKEEAGHTECVAPA